MGKPGPKPGTYKHTPEARAKISAANRGRKPSKKTRAKQSAARLGRKMHSEETKAKMSASAKAVWVKSGHVKLVVPPHLKKIETKLRNGGLKGKALRDALELYAAAVEGI